MPPMTVTASPGRPNPRGVPTVEGAHSAEGGFRKNVAEGRKLFHSFPECFSTGDFLAGARQSFDLAGFATLWAAPAELMRQPTLSRRAASTAK
jgi:hypothetical protein